ncbi:MAG: RNA 3'-terminal phosphate cyclase [Candidatus Bathyarchaeia archaeon]
MSAIEIDGSMLEGGGQILRSSIALGAVTGKKVRIYNVRANRKPPGLRPQHLTSIQAIAKMTNANVSGLSFGATEVYFEPNSTRAGEYSFDIGTAGSTTLTLQALLPAAAFATSKTSLRIQGGTDNPLAPPVDFLSEIFLPTIAKMGVQVEFLLKRRGFYPEGGGIFEISIRPLKTLIPINLMDFKKVKKVSGKAYSCRLPSHIVQRMAKSAKETLQTEYLDVDMIEESLSLTDEACSYGQGCGIILIAETDNGALLGGHQLGRRGISAEKVGQDAAHALLETLKTRAPVDEYLADQLVVWMSLANGHSTIKVSSLTLHTLTAIAVCERLLPVQFQVQGKKSSPAVISCGGIGFESA